MFVRQKYRFADAQIRQAPDTSWSYRLSNHNRQTDSRPHIRIYLKGLQEKQVRGEVSKPIFYDAVVTDLPTPLFSSKSFGRTFIDAS